MPRQSDLRFTFEPACGLPFDVVEFELEEGLSECFELKLELSSSDPAVDFGQILDQPALFTIWRGDTPVRYVHGLVSVLEQGETGFRRTRYRAVVEPQLARAGLRSDWRIFQQQSVPQIMQTLVRALGITGYEQIVTAWGTQLYRIDIGENGIDEQHTPYWPEFRFAVTQLSEAWGSARQISLSQKTLTLPP